MSSFFENRLNHIQKPIIVDKYFGDINGQPADSMSGNLISRFHEDALRIIVANTYKKSPFYRKKMDEYGVKPTEIKSLRDLRRLPFIEKSELRGHPWALLACREKDISIITVSTGTTGGEEIYIPTSWRDYVLNDMTPRYPSLFPVDPGDICIDALPFEMSSSGLAFHKLFMDACLATSFNAGKGGAYSTPEKTAKILQDIKPNIIITTPSWAIRIYEAALDRNFNLSSLPLKKMWLTGEGCSDTFRRKIEKIYGTTANMYYGSLECGGIGIECDKHEGYHIMQGHVIVEIVDPDSGAVLEPGEIGEIVVTCTLRFDTPLIRYRTGDLGYVEKTPCTCGVTAPRIFLRGRVADQMRVNGKSLSPYYLEEFLMRNEEIGNWYQFILRKRDPGYLKVRAELEDGFQPSFELEDKIASKMEYVLGSGCRVELVRRLPRTSQKVRRVIYEEDEL